MPTRRELGRFILESDSVTEFSRQVILNYNLSDNKNIKKLLSVLHRNYLTRWKNCNRTTTAFEDKYASWLDVEVEFQPIEETSTEDEPFASSGKRGRPAKKFEEAKERTRKKLIKKDADRLTTPQASRVLSSRLHRKGNRTGAACVKLFSSTSPKSAKGLYKKMKGNEKEIAQFTPEEALSLMIEAKLTKKSYSILRIAVKNKGADIFPTYNRLVEAKKLAYPKNITTTEVSSEVPVQDLLHHTTSRILETLGDTVEGKYSLICKWGFDGSSGQSEYKQGWEGDEFKQDQSVFVTSMVPLKLLNETGAIWENPRPSSTRFCRPIRLQFIKETHKVIKSEEHHIKSQIDRLQPFKIEGVEVNFNMNLTMINGKALCAITGTSTAQCPICRKTSDSKSWTQQSDPADETALSYGISPLHAYIRFLEFVLGISYRLDMQAKTSGDKALPEVKETKERVLQNLKKMMHIQPDRPKQGYGSTSDGNSARRFFADPITASKATGVDENIIRRFGVILFCLSSGREVITGEFEKYCTETSLLYEEKYSWYPMTPTVHKILVHGPHIMENAILPLGQLSEEAQEARNKDIRMYRQLFTRKTSRRMNIEDLFCRLMLSSDPVISSRRPLPLKSTRKLSYDVVEDLRSLFADSNDDSEDSRDRKGSDSSSEDSDF